MQYSQQNYSPLTPEQDADLVRLAEQTLVEFQYGCDAGSEHSAVISSSELVSHPSMSNRAWDADPNFALPGSSDDRYLVPGAVDQQLLSPSWSPSHYAESAYTSGGEGVYPSSSASSRASSTENSYPKRSLRTGRVLKSRHRTVPSKIRQEERQGTSRRLGDERNFVLSSFPDDTIRKSPGAINDIGRFSVANWDKIRGEVTTYRQLVCDESYGYVVSRTKDVGQTKWDVRVDLVRKESARWREANCMAFTRSHGAGAADVENMESTGEEDMG